MVRGEDGREMDWIGVVHRLRTIAGEGLAYARDPYDLDRYRRLNSLALEIAEVRTGMTELASVLVEEGYPTPKVDVRAVVFSGGLVLFVQEASDGGWSLPGGWADLGETPGQVAVREVAEETGHVVSPVRLLALYDKAVHDHPRSLQSVYKVFIDCQLSQPEASGAVESHEVLSVSWFDPLDPPALSTGRVTAAQLARMAELHHDPLAPADFD